MFGNTASFREGHLHPPTDVGTKREKRTKETPHSQRKSDPTSPGFSGRQKFHLTLPRICGENVFLWLCTVIQCPPPPSTAEGGSVCECVRVCARGYHVLYVHVCTVHVCMLFVRGWYLCMCVCMCLFSRHFLSDLDSTLRGTC
ncbi:hypothetical protein mRhiFer1_008684 [Rhinolophus ferrumequinum]|uniref:Uncharacterized protein n=1 Tax=Rhinolophus ferrumequinum TaxID=59479 RepID=A0A7J7TR51_RHIFE|nr:hypothetical protein mRhiFer1_008684 [Rhinolophus ferrumequinum]